MKGSYQGIKRYSEKKNQIAKGFLYTEIHFTLDGYNK